MLKATDGNTAVYYTRGFELISRREGTAASYYVYDGGRSVRALTNEYGAVTDTLVFDAFGTETGRTGATDNPYGFQGEEQDATGLYYLRARYMDPATGTFTTMDTYGGSLSDPMSLHKYLFANSNPVMYSDPSGHMTLAETECVFAIIGELVAADLYMIRLVSSDDYQEFDPGTFATYIIIGMIIGLIVGFIIYFIAYILPVLMALFGNQPEEIEKVVERLSYEPTSGAEVYSIAEKTTTVLGRYSPDMEAIIDELNLPKSLDYSGNIGGFNILNVPDAYYNPSTFWADWNYPFLQAALERGDKFIFATELWSNIFEIKEGTITITGYGKEILYIAFYKICESLFGG